MSNNKQRHNRDDLTLNKEKCFLAGAEILGRYQANEEPLSELSALVDTAGGVVVGKMTQKLDKPTNRYYLGKGKFYDLIDAAILANADTIVIDDDLTPAQLANIEEAARKKVVDRSEVILDIFQNRARSLQARLQIELAQMQYELPRLARKWTHLDRINGGIGGTGGASRGTGEKQIELDRRLIRERINRLRDELATIEKRKLREVGSREKMFTVCLVGYTNAGKSTLFNRLTHSNDAFVENRLFATLDTLTRKVTLSDGEKFLLSDTVGFIRRLPHHLVASFHATLEEAAQADLLLLVVDGADELAQTQIVAVEKTLSELGLSEKSRLYVFNKMDIAESRLTRLREEFAPAVKVSAQTGLGVDELLNILQTRNAQGRRSVTLRFSSGDGKRLALLNQFATNVNINYDHDTIIATAQINPADLERLKRLNGAMEIL